MRSDMFSDEPGDYILSSLSDMFEESEDYFLTNKEIKDWEDEWVEPEDYFNKDMFKEPDDYVNICVDIPKVSIKLSKEKEFINKLYQDHNSPYLLKLKTIKGTKAYIYKNEEYFDGEKFKCEKNLVLSDILYKEDNILYASGYKNTPMFITNDFSNILYVIDNNDEFNFNKLKNKNVEKLDVEIDLYHTKIVYIDTITVKQKVALMLSLMNYKDLPYDLDLFKKICNYIN